MSVGVHVQSHEVVIPAGMEGLPGTLVIPDGAIGVVLFAHGSGSSRHSPRNRFVASVLHQAGIATVLFDLLSRAEAEDRRNVFDIDLLCERLRSGVRWAGVETRTAQLPIGLFGASTGAAAALVAAAKEPAVRAVVSRGGRPDLADRWLPMVQAPTLLIVGGDDTEVVKLNRQALAALTCRKQLDIVPGATHLFEEEGTLDQAATLAAAWFSRHLSGTT